MFRLCLGKPRAEAGLRPDDCREGTCDHTVSSPRGRWNLGGRVGNTEASSSSLLGDSISSAKPWIVSGLFC